MKYATLDVGSNSILLHIAEKRGAEMVPVLDRANLSRLGEGLRQSGAFSEAAMERSLEALKDFAQLIDEHDAEAYAAVGTMALRNASNRDDFLAQVYKETGIQIEVIPGEEEARLSFMAVKSGLPSGAESVAIFDVGGGSTEFIFGAGDRIDRKFSLDIGALRLTEEILTADPVSPEQLDQCMRSLCDELKELEAGGVEALVGMGGTITNMAAIKLKMVDYDPSRIQGCTLSLEEMQEMLEMLRSKTIAERRELAGLQPKRADTILAGAAIVTSVAKQLGFDQLTISDRGIRHGLMADRFA